LGFGGELIFRPAPWETRFKAAYVRNEVDNELKAEPLALGARVQRLIRPRLSAFGQWGYLRDEFAGISARNNVEGGISYVPVDQAPHKLTLDAAVGYTNEQRLVDSDLSSATLVTGGLYTLKFSETSELSEDGRFTFLLSDGGDWRFTNIIALTAKMTTVFSLKLSNNIRYVSAPVVGFETTDSVTAIALVAKF
jgi:putative salt-induced outer membrane protein YdiY